MRRATLVLLCLSFGLGTILAQEPMLVAVTYVTVKPGMEAAFVQVAQEHLQWHEDTGDDHYYAASQVVTGPRTGQYVFSVGPMPASRLDDYDAFEATDMADIAQRGGMEMVESMERIVLQTISGLGNPPPPGHVAGLVHVWEIDVALDKTPQFLDALQKMSDAQTQVESDDHVAFAEIVSGGSLGTIMRIHWTSGWATRDVERERRVIEAAGGEEAYRSIMVALTGAANAISATSYRPLPELSFMLPDE